MKPGIPKGTRDFSPEQVNRRNYIFASTRSVFVKYAYPPLETPTMENPSTLTGKYGEEGDKLLFKVLNNGDFLAKADRQALEALDSNALLPSISKRGLRYDLTVPFARYVVMHQSELNFPFKRYQIQPVWRADRPQKSRYQEFYQCDVDAVGSDSLALEAELMQIYDEVFTRLQIPVEIRFNNRKVLAGIAEAAGITSRFMAMTVAIDKLDKIGIDGVKEEMRNNDIPEAAITTIEAVLALDSEADLTRIIGNTPSGAKGLEELRTVRSYLEGYDFRNELVFDVTLARGLNYYTGCIFEVKAQGVQIGSIGGGGRYDDLTGVFGMKDMSGVGISFGADRIYDVMEALDLFPARSAADLQVLLIAFDDATHRYAFRCLNQLRAAGIHSELYPDPVKLKKQMKYANGRKTPYVVLIGSEEMHSGQLTLKNMETGDQEKMPVEAIIRKFA